MANKILYYPYLNIPKDQWVFKSALYWDEIGVIIPHKYGEEENIVNQYTFDLLNEGVIKQIIPDNYIADREEFGEFLLQIINQKHFNIDLRRKAFKLGGRSRIHINKFYTGLMDSLSKMGIAEREKWSSWYYVENYTANVLMTYLANVIGKTGNFTIATDELNNFKTNIHNAWVDENILKLRDQFINEILPYPKNPDLKKLMKFKSKNQDSLVRFRNKVEKILLNTALIDSAKNQQKALKLELKAINDEKEYLLRKMNESKIGDIIYSALGGIITAGFILYFTQIPELAIGPLYNSIEGVFNVVEKDNITDHEISYLVLAEKKLNK